MSALLHSNNSDFFSDINSYINKLFGSKMGKGREVRDFD